MLLALVNQDTETLVLQQRICYNISDILSNLIIQRSLPAFFGMLGAELGFEVKQGRRFDVFQADRFRGMRVLTQKYGKTPKSSNCS